MAVSHPRLFNSIDHPFARDPLHSIVSAVEDHVVLWALLQLVRLRARLCERSRRSPLCPMFV